MRTILKLGGSVVTHKDQPDTIDWDGLEQSVTTVAAAIEEWPAENDLVIVHGGGSFGHHHAATHGVSSEDGTHDATAVVNIHQAMGELNDAILGTLHDYGVDAVPVKPLSVAHRDWTDQLHLPSQQVQTMLDEGFVPVLHGDMVAHEGNGCVVLSGDDIVVSLARSLRADRVGLCSIVPGVLDENDEVIDKISSYEDVASILGESASTDVTGGMAGKVKALLDLSVRASIFDPEQLDQFLHDGAAGTVIQDDA